MFLVDFARAVLTPDAAGKPTVYIFLRTGWLHLVWHCKVYIELQSLEQRFRQHKGYRRESTQAKIKRAKFLKQCRAFDMMQRQFISIYKYTHTHIYTLYRSLTEVDWSWLSFLHSDRRRSFAQKKRQRHRLLFSLFAPLLSLFFVGMFDLESKLGRRLPRWCSVRTELHLASTCGLEQDTVFFPTSLCGVLTFVRHPPPLSSSSRRLSLSTCLYQTSLNRVWTVSEPCLNQSEPCSLNRVWTSRNRVLNRVWTVSAVCLFIYLSI